MKNPSIRQLDIQIKAALAKVQRLRAIKSEKVSALRAQAREKRGQAEAELAAKREHLGVSVFECCAARIAPKEIAKKFGVSRYRIGDLERAGKLHVAFDEAYSSHPLREGLRTGELAPNVECLKQIALEKENRRAQEALLDAAAKEALQALEADALIWKEVFSSPPIVSRFNALAPYFTRAWAIRQGTLLAWAGGNRHDALAIGSAILEFAKSEIPMQFESWSAPELRDRILELINIMNLPQQLFDTEEVDPAVTDKLREYGFMFGDIRQYKLQQLQQA